MSLVSLCSLVAACQPMYKEKAEPLKAPPQRIRRAQPEPPPVETAFVETCDVNFTAKPTNKRETSKAQQLTVQANAALQPTITAPTRPSAPATIQSVQDAITMYREALIKDPYNAEATLKLALAYDRLLRKGCALAMLRRLATLETHPLFHDDAEPMVELVEQNPHWFPPYYRAALQAVGR